MKKIIDYLIKKKIKLKKKEIPLHEPNIDLSDQKEVLRSLKSGYVSSVGNDIDKFEKKLKSITKSKFLTTVINGTSAIHLGLKVIGVKPSHEVLVPALNFIASVNAILYLNATPHFVDSEREHFGVDPEKLETYLNNNSYIKNNCCYNKKTNKIIKALIIVHVFGHPARLPELLKICKKFKIKILEDAAEALGSYYEGKHVGTFGDIGILSFNGNKIVTTGSGGAILTKSKKKYLKLQHLATTAKVKHNWDFIHNEIGYNYRLANINASLGLSQLKKLKFYIKKKRNLFNRYKTLLGQSKDYFILNEPPNCKSNFWLQTLVLNNSSKKNKIKILKDFHKKKLLIRPVWKPLHKMKYLKKFPKMNLKNTNMLENKIINLPSSHYL